MFISLRVVVGRVDRFEVDVGEGDSGIGYRSF